MKKTKLFHSIIAFTLILSILFSLFVFGPVTLSATAEESNTSTEEIEYWDGSTAESFAGDGDGSAENPFLIENGAQLRLLVTSYCSADYESYYFKLTKDIYLNEVADGTHVKSLADKNNWAEGLTAGSKENSFYGTLDGDGHTIYGLYAYGEEAVLGLFPGINSATVVKNLNFDNLYINGASSSGAAIAGVAYYYTWQKTAQISNCSVINAVIGQNQNMEFAAGLVADTHEVKVSFTNCYSHSNTFSDWTTGAGFVANDWDGGATTYNNCYSAGAYPVSAAVNKATINNVYTNVSAPEGTVAEGIVTLEDDQMKGTAAKENMTGFDFALTWKTVENDYPVFSDIEVWDGTASTSLKGSGTAADPFLIENGADLRYMADQVVTYSNLASTTCPYYKIVNDIYLNAVTDADVEAAKAATLVSGYAVPTGWETKNTWRTHSSQSTGFYGVVDGGEHTIYGLFVPNTTYAGLFNNVVGATKITNLHIEDSYIYGKCAGGFVGSAYGANTNLTLTGCTVNNIAVEGQTSSVRVGCLVGGGESTGGITVTNSSVTRSAVKSPYANYPSIESGFVGYIGKNVVVVKNSFIDDSAHPLSNATNSTHFETNMGAYATYSNVYYIRRADDDSRTFLSTSTVEQQFTVLTAEQMKGEDAKTYMPGLDFTNVWQTVEGDFPVIKANPTYPWDGSSAASHDDFKGSGTAEDPYLIENGAQLYFAAIKNSNLTDGSYYKLVRDIVLNDTSVADWEASANPWGMNSAKRFNGTLDGDGHTIEGLYINVDSTSGRYGLFSYVGQDTSVSDKVAEIKNITLKGASVTNTTTSSFEGVGIVAGQASGETIFENIYIDENCKVNAPNVKGVAGIVARSSVNVTINNCAVHGTYTGSSHVSSFLGTFWGGTQTISNSYSAANVPVTTSRTPTIVNVYATVKTEDDYYDADVVLLTSEEMMGDNALTNMVGFDFDFMWKTVEDGYPVLRDMDERLPAWSGDIATTLKGDGTKANPYKISNGAELYYMVSTYSNQPVDTLIENKPYFELTSDINLGNAQWYNVGTTSYPSSSNYTTGFAGVIYGNGHTVYNLNNAASVAVAGLIPVATQGTEIYDLHLDKGNLPKVVWNTYVVGGLIGLAVATNNSTPITISGCSVENYTIGSRDGSAAFVGDTYSQSLIIKDCYAVNNTISHTSTTATMNTGAFVGIVDGNGEGNSIVIKNSYTDGDADIGYVKEMSTTFNNVYTTDDSYLNTVNGLSKVTAAEITGDTAKSNLNGFNFNQIWAVVEDSTPVHTGMDYRANYFSGNAAEDFAGGSGTEADPYIIKTADQLYLLANLDRDTTYGKYYKLANDITISDTSYTNWQNDDPFTWAVKKAYLDGFTYTSSFAGILDGAGYTVSGLYYNNVIADDGNYAYGLIPFVTADAVIKNITVSDTNAVVSGDGAYVGAVAGAAHVMKEDIEASILHAVQFVGVNVTNATIGATNKGDILGGASYGVKFDLCNTTNDIYGTIKGYFVENNCNNSSSYRKDVVVVNNITAADTYATVRRVLIGADKTTYISSIDMSTAFNVCDLFAAKLGMVADEPEEYLVWSDEFNGTAINTSVWTKSSTSMSTGTTLEYANNATFDGENVELNCYDTGKTDANGDKIYSINHGLHTADTMSYKYGRLEMRAKIPVGAGAFPALWLSSRGSIGYDTNSEFSTEVDVFEVFGKTANESTAIACIHKWYNADGVRTGDECSCGSGLLTGNLYEVETADRSTTVSYEWCTVVFEWTEDTMTFSIDGVTYYTAKRSEMDNFDISGYDTNSDGVFNQFMYPIITNHMYTTGEGAAYSYTGNASEIESNYENLTFEIDYIRLYQKNDGKSEINLK